MRSREWLFAAAVSGAAIAATGLVGACGARTGLDVGAADSSAVVDGGGRVDARKVEPIDCVKEGITYIYVIDEENELYSYYPQTAEFTDIGPIACPARVGSTPFSMAVDRSGVAYVVFDDGELFRLSTKTAACEATSFAIGQDGFDTFGMGFVANKGDGGETLFVARDNPGALGTIDVTNFVLREVAPFASSSIDEAELTGTGDGRLFGFYAPSNLASPSFIVQIDPVTAEVLGSVALDGVVEGNAWAFGFWGGDFYTFTAPDDVTTVVTRYRPSDGSVVQVATAPFGVTIVGAGVSTCAPQQ